MATQTRPVGSYENGLVTISLKYDDTTDFVTAVVVSNQSDQPIYVEAVQEDAIGVKGRKYGDRFLPFTTTEIPIGTGAAVRMRQVCDGRGRWDGIGIHVVSPG